MLQQSQNFRSVQRKWEIPVTNFSIRCSHRMEKFVTGISHLRRFRSRTTAQTPDKLLIDAPKHMLLIIICIAMLLDLCGAHPHHLARFEISCPENTRVPIRPVRLRTNTRIFFCHVWCNVVPMARTHSGVKCYKQTNQVQPPARTSGDWPLLAQGVEIWERSQRDLR
jgi:hypothetical protein